MPSNYELAFWGTTAVATDARGFRLIDVADPTAPRVVADVPCSAPADVSVWGHLVFLSVDSVQSDETCASRSVGPPNSGWEGLRIVDVSDPARPVLAAALEIECGSHTHTVVPDLGRERLLLYVSSYAGPPTTCGVPRSEISIVEVPLAAPSSAAVVAQPAVSPAGCHDIQVFLPLKIAAASCIDEGQIWDIADPVRPQVLHRIFNPAIQIWHSASFSWDGEIVAFGDETAGGFSPGCLPGHNAVGALWFYRVADPIHPVGSFSLPRAQLGELCTTHNFNVIPTPDRRLLVSSYYGGGTAIIDFTDPARPVEIAHYDPPAGIAYSSYWYDGYVYVNDLKRGLEILSFDHPAAAGARRFGHLNAQTQEPASEASADGR